MALLSTPVCDFGKAAVDFTLPGTDGRTWSLQQCRGANGTLIMFICNHCPYVKAVQKFLVRDAGELLGLGVNTVAIMSNNVAVSPDDSLENMQRVAAEFQYPFPYLIDETQQVASAYGAVCTPDFFGYNRDLKLQYRGRLDESTPSNVNTGGRRELFDAMSQIAQTGHGPSDQIPSMGCSIKWR